MLTPAATAARMASEPEWKNVPSPRFWTRCGRVDERRHADPLGALVAHRVMPASSPTRSGSISATIAWQPMPPPTSAPSGTLVRGVVGAAGAEERRAGSIVSGISWRRRRRGRPASGAQALGGEACGEARRSRTARRRRRARR